MWVVPLASVPNIASSSPEVYSSARLSMVAARGGSSAGRSSSASEKLLQNRRTNVTLFLFIIEA
jgi:hypothetical protein